MKKKYSLYPLTLKTLVTKKEKTTFKSGFVSVSDKLRKWYPFHFYLRVLSALKISRLTTARYIYTY